MAKDKNKNNKSDFLLWKLFTKDVDPIKDPDWEAQERELRDDEGEKARNAVRETPILSDQKLEKSAKILTQSDFQMDRKTDERLRKGKIHIEGTLDLHGKNQGQAKEALERFILGAVKQNKRCVLVITGKGKTGQTSDHWMSSGEGVLKKKVPDWLSMTPLNQHVLRFVSATPSHGGQGALYVYLRKAR